MLPRVLFVSKPIAPPFHDGTKCLVRDIAAHVTRVRPIVLTVRGANGLGEIFDAGVERAEVYRTSGAFTPRLSDNLRAARWVLLSSRADLWHFVFAPNPRTSSVGRVLKRLRGMRVIQTVASPPRSFAGVGRLLFGDVIVVQSRWTRERIEQACEDERLTLPRIEVIPPPVPELEPRSRARVQALLGELELDASAPLFVYPGDLETSRGAETVAGIAEELARTLPDAAVVFAYRNKSQRAPEIAAALAARLRGKRVRFVRELDDVLELVAAATAVLFPVDDLWGKVDLPIVLLEAMALGVPVLVLDQGPLSDLEGAGKLESLEVSSWTQRCIELSREPEARQRAADAGRQAVRERYHAARVAERYEELYLELARRS